MTEPVMQDPYREAIDGKKIVSHEFRHGLDWSINVSHVLLIIVAIAGVYYYKTTVVGSNTDDTETPNNIIDTTE